VASLGLYKGVAEIYGIKLRGIIAWFMHRTYHVSRMPTWNRRIRIVFDWTGALFLGREVVSLGQINDPRADFHRVAGTRPASNGSATGPNPPVGDTAEERLPAAGRTA
jgi:NADH dehydrogenase